MTYRSLFLQK